MERREGEGVPLGEEGEEGLATALGEGGEEGEGRGEGEDFSAVGQRARGLGMQWGGGREWAWGRRRMGGGAAEV